MLQKGENLLVLVSCYDCHQIGLEALYILGEFGVQGDSIIERAQTLKTDNWCLQTLPYYSGNMIYQKKLGKFASCEKVFIKIPDWQGSAIGLKVNNSKEIDCTFSRKELEITEFLSNNSDNELQIIVYGHRRNAMGPFYLKESSPTWTDSLAIRTVEQKERNLVVCGLLSPVELSIKQ